MSSLNRRIRKNIAFILLLLPFVISPLLLGGVFHHIFWSRVIIGVVSASMIAVLFFYTVNRRRLFVSAALLLPLLLGGIALFQLIPLPSSLYCLFSVERCSVLTDSGLSLHPLSLAPTETLYSFFRLLTLTLFTFVLSTFIKSKPDRVYNLAKGIVFITTGFIVLALLMHAAGIEQWLDGTFKPHAIFFSFPIINSNNCGGWLGVSAIISLFLLQTKNRNEKMLYVFIFIIHAIALISSFSRGAILAFLISVVLYVVASRFSQKKEFYYLIFALVPIVLLVFYAGYTTAERELFPDSGMQDKLEGAFQTVKLLSSFPLFGIGLGAFSSVFSLVEIHPERHFVYPENDPIHLMIEVGFVGTILFFALLIFIIVRHKKPVEIVPYIALFFVALHNLVDFNIHIFAVQFPVMFLLVWIAESREVVKKSYRYLIVSVALFVGISSVLYALLTQHKEFKKQLETESYETMTYRYPFSYRVPLKKAIALLKDKKEYPYAGVYLTKTITLAPRYYYPQFLSAVYLLKIGAVTEASHAFSHTLALAQKDNIRHLIPTIFSMLKLQNRRDLFPGILLSLPRDLQNDIEPTVARLVTSGVSSLFSSVRDTYPVVYARSLLFDKKYDETEQFVNNHLDTVTESQRISLLHILALVKLRTRRHQEALSTLKKLMEVHDTFSSTMQYASTLLHYGEYTPQEMALLQKRMMEQSKGDKKKTARLYYWLSEVSWKQKKYKNSLNALRKALLLEDHRGWRLTLVKKLQYAGIYRDALKHLTIIQQRFPQWRTEYLKKLEMTLKEKDKNTIF